MALGVAGWLGCAGPRALVRSGDTRIHCEPPEAELTLDGVRMGNAEEFDGRVRLLRLGSGAHRVTLSHPGYQTFQAELTGGDWRQTVDVRLEPLTN